MTKNKSEMERVFIPADKFQTIPSHHLSSKMKEWKGRFLKKRNSWTVLARYQEDIEKFLTIQEETEKEENTISDTMSISDTINIDIEDYNNNNNNKNNNDNLPLLSRPLPQSPRLENEFELEIPLPIYELLEWMWSEIDKSV
jgi:hypothetical protein